MDVEIRPITPEELPAYARVVETAFGIQPDDEILDLYRDVTEIDRTLAALAAGRIVATAGALSFELTLPWRETVAAAGITSVGVLPTYRRRGLLTALMTRLLEDVVRRGEPVAVLLASESPIYGRFGYGLATSAVSLEVERAHAALARTAPATGELRLLDPGEATEVVPDVFERARIGQPGQVSRTPGWWAAHFRDPERDREGASARFYVVHDGTAGAGGYASYRVRQEWAAGLASNTLVVEEIVASTPEVRAELWQFCLSVDLMARVVAPVSPVDEPLRFMLADPRRLRVTALGDILWVRLLDVARALAGRRYGIEGGLVLDVRDAFLPANEGRYRLRGGPAGASCAPTTEGSDLALDVRDLAAAFLGGVSWSNLARAGRVDEHRAGALARADAMFACHPAPFCSTDF